MFALGEKVVYPGHGVAQIKEIIKKSVGVEEVIFYELVFLGKKEATVLVPVSNSECIGLRSLSTSDGIEKAFSIMMSPSKKICSSEFPASNWNKRNKEYQLKLRTGSIFDLSEMYRDLKRSSQKKELSYGEKNLLNQAEHLLMQEISIVQEVTEEKAMENIRKCVVRTDIFI